MPEAMAQQKGRDELFRQNLNLAIGEPKNARDLDRETGKVTAAGLFPLPVGTNRLIAIRFQSEHRDETLFGIDNPLFSDSRSCVVAALFLVVATMRVRAAAYDLDN